MAVDSCPLVVGLAVVRALDRVADHDVLRDFEVRERRLEEAADLVGSRWRGGGDHRRDPLAEALVRQPNDKTVVNERVALDRLFDLLGENLLATRVDAVRSPPVECDRTISIDGRPVAGDGEGLTVELDECPRRRRSILVVANGTGPAGKEPSLAAPNLTSRPSSVITRVSGDSVKCAVPRPR
jgi:hypothetical protein